MKTEDRHVGTRENIWFPFDEHERMLDCMAELKETNKSNFIRTAIHNFIKAVDEEKKARIAKATKETK